MNYKYSFLIVLFSLVILKANTQNQFGPVEVKYVDFQIESIIDINPDQFDSSFSSEYRFWYLDQHDSIAHFVYSCLGQFQKTKAQSINVRLEITYSIDHIEQKKWMNKFGLFTDGKNCYRNEKLYHFLKNILQQ